MRSSEQNNKKMHFSVKTHVIFIGILFEAITIYLKLKRDKQHQKLLNV